MDYAWGVRRLGLSGFAVALLLVWACSTYGEATGPAGTSSSSSGECGTEGGADAQVDRVTPGVFDDAAVDPPPAPPALVGDWPFDEGTGAAIGDATSNGHDGVAAGGSWTTNRKGAVGSAFTFATNGDHVAVKAHQDFDRPAGGKLTITAWAKPVGTPSHWYIFEIGFGTEGFGLELLDGDSMSYWDGSNHVATASVDDIGAWHHYGVVVDGAKVRTFVDGLPVGNGTGSDVPRTADKVYLGRDVVDPVYLKGSVDQVRFFRGALSDVEMLAEKNR
jgi:hypothetical protein